VISSAKPTLPATENGFVPLKDFDLAKPFDGVAEYLKNWEKRLEKSPIDPANAFDKLKEERNELESKFKEKFEQRIRDIADRYDVRTGELKKHHDEIENLYKQWSGVWEQFFRSMETQRDKLVEDSKDTLIEYYEKRIEELGKFHEDVKNELGARIGDLERREKEWKDKAEYLERERDRHLDERREWLRDREEKFDEEKKDERNQFVALRKDIVKNEYDVEKTAGRILAEKFSWGWAAGFILAVVIIIVLSFCIWKFSTTGSSSPPPLSPQTSQEETSLTLSLEKNTDKENQK